MRRGSRRRTCGSRPASRSCRSRRSRPDGAEVRHETTRSGARRRVPPPHDLRVRGDRGRIQLGTRRLERPAHAPWLAVVDPHVVPRRDNYDFGRPAGLRAHRLLPRGRALPADPGHRPRPADRPGQRLTVIGVLSDTAPIELAASRPRRRPWPARFPGRTQPTVYWLGLAPGVDPERPLGESSRRCWSTGWRPRRSTRRRELRRVLPDVQLPDRGLHGARSRGGRRRARRDQRPRGRRAAPADRGLRSIGFRRR